MENILEEFKKMLSYISTIDEDSPYYIFKGSNKEIKKYNNKIKNYCIFKILDYATLLDYKVSIQPHHLRCERDIYSQVIIELPTNQIISFDIDTDYINHDFHSDAEKYERIMYFIKEY